MKPKPKASHTEDSSAALRKRSRRARVTVKIDHPQHGKMEVHSMRNIFHGEPCTLMASSAVGTAEQPVWIQLAKQGRFLGHSAGPFEMTSSTFEEIVRNFKAHPEHVPIDFEHASESDASSGSIPHTGAPAQGWIVDMKVENGNLFGLVEWGSLARDYIKNGQYKYFSPAIRFGAKDRVSGKPIGARMTSGALTNSPFLSGLQKVAAKDDVDDLEDELDDEENPASADEENPEEGDSEMEAKTLKDVEDKLAVMNDRFTLADAKVKDLEKTVTAKDAELVTLRAENTGLLDWKTKREDKDAADAVEVAFSTYKDQRKLTDALKEPMLAMMKAAPDAFAKMYPVVAPAQRHLLREITPPRSNETKPEDSGEEMPDLIKLADKIQGEKKCDRGAALIEADKQLRAMRSKR